jgi:hypothetical protein
MQVQYIGINIKCLMHQTVNLMKNFYNLMLSRNLIYIACLLYFILYIISYGLLSPITILS